MRHKAILELYPDCIGITDGVGAFDKDQNLISLDETLIQKKITELQADYDSKKYQRDRLQEYPSIQELVVALYDADDKAEIDKKRAEIKNKYPKPE